MADETPYGKLTLKSLKEAVEHVFSQERNKPKKERKVKLLRGCATYGMIDGFNHCGNKECYSCNYYASVLQDQFKKELEEKCAIYGIIAKWQEKLNLNHIFIETEEISREQVTFPDDISDEDKYFIGIRLEGDTAIIYHDRDLTEEDIVHELLHLANPDKSEEWINTETKNKLNEN